MKNIAFAFPMHYRTIALATIVALLAWSLGLPAMIHNANADNVVEFSDTLSDSDIGLDATHTLQFELVNAIAASETLRVTFDPDGQEFDLTGLALGDINISAVSGGTITEVAAVGNCTGAASEMYASDVDDTADFIELTVCPTDSITAGTVVQIVAGVTNFIANPATADSYVIRLGGTMTDSGDTRIAVIDDVTVTASVSL
ncbi:MAG: hypothetical protein UU98_C0007G0009 [Parcubacteria group bacterium GW2011_GWD2_42_14]|nr:MAG: hypothetical protein UU98_C0007G0009 [Parcubacteria group bacterium GW2011_GWD2_42_14]